MKKSNRTKNYRVRKCWKLPTFTNPSSGGPDEWPCSLLLPPLLKNAESWELSIFSNSVIFGRIRLFHSIFGNITASPFILKTFQTTFHNEKWPKKASEVGGRAICSGAIVFIVITLKPLFFLLNGHCYCFVVNLPVVGVNRKVSKRPKHEKINFQGFITFNIHSGWPCRSKAYQKTSPEAQRTQGVESITWFIYLTDLNWI